MSENNLDVVKFAVGDVVRVMGTGIPMTIEGEYLTDSFKSYYPTRYKCVWFNTRAELQRANFSENVLVKRHRSL